MSVTTRIKYALRVTDDGDHSEIFDGSQGRHLIEKVIEWADGTGANQADLAFSDQRTISAAANEDIDLAGGHNDAYGNAVTLVKIKLLVVENTNTADGDDLQVGPASSNGCDCFWADSSDRNVVPAGGALIIYDPNGLAVTAGTGDLINIAEVGGSNANTYNLLVVGTSS